jgi:hypothetical protein
MITNYLIHERNNQENTEMPINQWKSTIHKYNNSNNDSPNIFNQRNIELFSSNETSD